MKHVVSFSGGRTSAYLCRLMLEKYGKENVDFIYCDTGAEHPETYKFIKRVNDEFGLDLTCIRVDVNPELGKGNNYRAIAINDCKPDLEPWKAILSKYGTPYAPSGGFCTDMLKTQPFIKYCKDHYGDDYTCWLGMRIDEPKRLKGLEEKQVDMFGVEKPKPKRRIRYLAEISDFDKQDVLEWWAGKPYDLDLPEVLGNCVFCIKAGVNKVALAARLEHQLANEFMEVIASDTVRVTDREMPSEIMYRDGHSLKSIIATYKDFSEEEIEQTIRSMKRYDTGSCSESCEAFSDNLDLFEL